LNESIVFEHQSNFMKSEKRTLAIAILLCALCSASFGQGLILIRAAQDDATARAAVCSRPELKPLHDAYVEDLNARLKPLNADDIAMIFGPKLQPAADWTGYGVIKKPADLVLPLFAPGNSTNGMMSFFVSGRGATPPDVNKRHTDLHAIGDIGYLECYYASDGVHKDATVIYFRADDKFVPLASTNDFSKRLEWEKSKFDALNKWFDKNVSLTELGVVEFSPATLKRIDLGGGTACFIIANAVEGGSYWGFTISKDTLNLDEKKKSMQSVSFKNRPLGPMSFSIDGKFYRLKPVLVEKLHEPVR